MIFNKSHVLLAVLALVFTFVSVGAKPSVASNRNSVKEIVVHEAILAGLKPSLALAVAKVESDFQPQALSSAGARGVMQIMPATAWGEYRMPADRLWDVHTNIRLGIDFLGNLIDRYNGQWDLALSHYNGGSIKNKRPHDYTRDYVRKVLNWEKRYAQQHDVWTVTVAEKSAQESYQIAFADISSEYLGSNFYKKFKRQRENNIAMAFLEDELQRRDTLDQPRRDGRRLNEFSKLSAPRNIRSQRSGPLGPIVRWRR